MAGIKLPPVPQSQLMARSVEAIWRDWYNKLMRAFAAKIDTITGKAGFLAMFDASGNLESSDKIPPTGEIVGTTDAQTLTNKTLTEPAIADFTLAQHDHTATSEGGNVVEASLNLSDVTTNNASTTKHGFMPRLTGDATKFFNGQGSQVVISTGDVHGPATNHADYVPQWDGANSKTIKDGKPIGAANGIVPTDSSNKIDGDFLPALSTLKRGSAPPTVTVTALKYLRDDDTWAVPPTTSGSGVLPDGAVTGDIIRWNATSSVWEVKSEPFEFKGIVLTPALASLVNAEGAIYYNSTDKAVMVCTGV